MNKQSTVPFAEARLTVLTDEYRAEKSTRKRKTILREALPLCQTVPDVKALLGHTHLGDSLNKMIYGRWDEITISLIRGSRSAPPTTLEFHRFYLLCRSGSEAEEHCLYYWYRFNKGIREHNPFQDAA